MSDRCVVCATAGPTTRGHVPGRLFFPSPRPSDLITVPTCDDCNNGRSVDEEYFLATYLFSQAGVTAVGERIWSQRQHRALQKNIGLRRAIAAALERVQLATPTGLWLAHRHAVRLDHKRLERVVDAIVRGLYYFETGAIVASDTALEVRPVLTDAAMDLYVPLAKHTREGKRGWDGVFEYRLGVVPELPQGSIWFLRFFGKVCYAALTLPRELASK